LCALVDLTHDCPKRKKLDLTRLTQGLLNQFIAASKKFRVSPAAATTCSTYTGAHSFDLMQQHEQGTNKSGKMAERRRSLGLLMSLAWLVASTSGASLPIKAVNLGGWLVVEGWMTNLFDRVDKDALMVISCCAPIRT
jgi:hypothetical protein